MYKTLIVSFLVTWAAVEIGAWPSMFQSSGGSLGPFGRMMGARAMDPEAMTRQMLGAQGGAPGRTTSRGEDSRPKITFDRATGAIRMQYNPRFGPPTEKEQYRILVEDHPKLSNDIAAFRHDEFKPVTNQFRRQNVPRSTVTNDGNIRKKLSCGGDLNVQITGIADEDLRNRLTKEMRNVITGLCLKQDDPNPTEVSGFNPLQTVIVW